MSIDRKRATEEFLWGILPSENVSHMGYVRKFSVSGEALEFAHLSERMQGSEPMKEEEIKRYENLSRLAQTRWIDGSPWSI